jgi:hypothetical protein
VRKHEAGDVYDSGTSHRQQLCALVERQLAMHRGGFPIFFHTETDKIALLNVFRSRQSYSTLLKITVFRIAMATHDQKTTKVEFVLSTDSNGAFTFTPIETALR